MPKPTDDEMKAAFEPHIAKHFSADHRAALAGKPFDQVAVTAAWDALIAEAKALMIKGDPTSPEALGLAPAIMGFMGQAMARLASSK